MHVLSISQIFRSLGKIRLKPPLSLARHWQYPQLAKRVIERWMVADSGRKNSTGKPVLALFQQINNGAWQEAVSDVYALKITLEIIKTHILR